MDKRLIAILFLFLIIVAGLCFWIYSKRNSFQNEPEITSICAFDLDNTLTCGLTQAAEAISACKELGAKIAIVTARPTPWYSDIKLKQLGLQESDFIDDFYHGEAFKCSFTDRDCMENSISSTKVKHLKTLAEKYQVDPKKIILFDDQYYNVKGAWDSGYSGIYANHDQCGMPLNVSQRVREILT